MTGQGESMQRVVPFKMTDTDHSSFVEQLFRNAVDNLYKGTEHYASANKQVSRAMELMNGAKPDFTNELAHIGNHLFNYLGPEFERVYRQELGLLPQLETPKTGELETRLKVEELAPGRMTPYERFLDYATLP